MGLALSAVFDMMREGGRHMKKFMFTAVFAVFAVFALFSLTACMKDDLSNIDIKVDGDLKTSYSTGSGGSVMGSRARTGISF